MDKHQAQSLIEQRLEENRNPLFNGEVVILEEHTIETDFGWVFFYQTKRWVETGDMMDGLVGNAPFIIDRRDGSIHVTGTARPTQYYIENYRSTGDPHREKNAESAVKSGSWFLRG